MTPTEILSNYSYSDLLSLSSHIGRIMDSMSPQNNKEWTELYHKRNKIEVELTRRRNELFKLLK